MDSMFARIVRRARQPASNRRSCPLAARNAVHVRAWDNAGVESGDSTWGPVCYDTVPPVTTAVLARTTASGVYTGAVMVNTDRNRWDKRSFGYGVSHGRRIVTRLRGTIGRVRHGKA